MKRKNADTMKKPSRRVDDSSWRKIKTPIRMDTRGAQLAMAKAMVLEMTSEAMKKKAYPAPTVR
jgi:DNA-binding cell septation regulator SpoVG